MSVRNMFLACLRLVGAAVLSVALLAGWYSYTKNRNFREMREKGRLVCQQMPLHCLVQGDAFADIERYVAQRRNLELRDNWGQTALYWAIRNDKQRTAEILLKAGANPDTKNERGQSILSWVTFPGMIHYAELLLAHDANIYVMNDETSPRTTLHGCVLYNKTECVGFLLVKGA